MGTIVWIVVIGLILGIVFLSGDSQKEGSREKHLEALVDMFDAEKQEISGRPNSYELRFEFHKVPFLYEDIEDKIFDKIVYRGFLRVNLAINLNIIFTERTNATFRSAPAALAQNPSSGRTNQIDSPRGFRDFNIFSNKPEIAVKLFEDEAVIRIFAKFKNKDSRGKPEMALEIVDGVLLMKFYPIGQQLEPTVFDLRNNTSLMENFLEDMLVICRRMEKIDQEISQK